MRAKTYTQAGQPPCPALRPRGTVARQLFCSGILQGTSNVVAVPFSSVGDGLDLGPFLVAALRCSAGTPCKSWLSWSGARSWAGGSATPGALARQGLCFGAASLLLVTCRGLRPL